MNQKIGIGERIRAERERLGFSQPAFAALGDSSKNSQLSWEKETAYPNARVLEAWARVGADTGFIVTGRLDAGALTAEEETLIGYFRGASRDVRRAALGALIGATPPGGQSSHGRDVTMTNNATGGVQIGMATGKVRVAKGS